MNHWLIIMALHSHEIVRVDEGLIVLLWGIECLAKGHLELLSIVSYLG